MIAEPTSNFTEGYAKHWYESVYFDTEVIFTLLGLRWDDLNDSETRDFVNLVNLGASELKQEFFSIQNLPPKAISFDICSELKQGDMEI